MTNIYIMTAFLLSLLLSLSCQSITIEAREGKGCIGKCYPSPTPSPSHMIIDSEDIIIQECMDHNGHKMKCHCKCPKSKSPTPSPSNMDSKDEAVNKKCMDLEGHRSKCPPYHSSSMIHSEEVVIKECMNHKGHKSKCHCKCHKPKAPTPSAIDYEF
ncbi:uncharacterized protein LOC111828725 [Capsella rubella]|uniref:uncharacterized protein LOC111828725 n=1 Tax=Capsella rubella TaxID=81985 RepID=UPI000CD50E0E|nr:uncharacterized protein LOC111828725 [Capsella rubella]